MSTRPSRNRNRNLKDTTKPLDTTMLTRPILSRAKALASTSLAADIRAELFGGPSGVY
jgi:hypothetical protein